MIIRRIIAVLFILLGLVASFIPIGFAGSGNVVYIIPVKDEITPTMAAFLAEEITNANISGAQGIIIEMSTLGGRVDSALSMKNSIINSDIPVVVYVQERAISAGALITIAAETIIMAPASQIGAAEPRPFDEKTVAFVRGEFGATADARGRDPKIAEAMVDKNIEIEGLVGKGEILSMKASDAKEYGYADEIFSTRQEILDFMDWSDVIVVEKSLSLSMRIAQFLTSYAVASILLSIGTIAIFVEISTSGFGAAGIVGITCFTLYFGGNMIAGYTQWWPMILFILGLGLLVAEIIMPGFGVLGIGGIASMVVSVVLAAPDWTQGISSLGIAILVSIIIIPILFKIISKKTNLFKRLVLSEAETVENGYVNVKGNEYLTGKKGKTITTLRPAGTILIDDKRVDAVTDGEFLPKDTDIEVLRVEGARIVVGKINEN
ncbi:UNVERIFIED_CONTAM: membrane-bound serine protease (ClpP class) [Acetivibrio alkalicellulosi]